MAPEEPGPDAAAEAAAVERTPDAEQRPDADPAHAGDPAETAWQRRRRLDAIFGDVLPETTRDERDPGGGAARESADDAWLRAQVPPHHGG